MRFALLAPALACVVFARARQITDAEVMRVHRSTLIIDTHNDVPMKTVKGYDIGKPAPRGSTDIPRLKAGNVGATFFAAYVPESLCASERRPPNTPEQSSIRFGMTLSGGIPRRFVLAKTADDIVNARKRGKIAALIGLKAATPSKTARNAAGVL